MKRTGYSSRQPERSPLQEQLLYRRPMTVAEIRVFPRCHNTPAYPVCPRCGRTMEWEYAAFCDRCGQMLDWSGYHHAKITYVEPNNDVILGEHSVCSD